MSKTYRSKEQWIELFQAHKESGLTAAAFCRQQGINAKYFSKRQKDFGFRSSTKNEFIQVKVDKPLYRTVMSLNTGHGQIEFNTWPDPDYVHQLLKVLR
jgi:hypothetical protein